MDFNPISPNCYTTISTYRNEAEAHLRANPTAHAWLADTHEYGYYNWQDFTTTWTPIYSNTFTDEYTTRWVSTCDPYTRASTIQYVAPAPQIDQEDIDELL